MSGEIISSGTAYYSTTDDDDIATVVILCHVNNGFDPELSDATKNGFEMVVRNQAHAPNVAYTSVLVKIRRRNGNRRC